MNLSGLVRIVFAILVLESLPVLAQRAYTPPVAIERDHQTFVVNGDGTYIQYMENSFRIRTPKGAEDYGSREISYISSQEEILSVDAWTITRDGTRIPVPPSAIRDREEDNSGGVAEFSDSKIKAIIFPRVAVGSLTSYKVVSRVHATPYPGEFTAGFVFSPSFVFSDWEAQFVLPESKKLYVDKRGVTGGLAGQDGRWLVLLHVSLPTRTSAAAATRCGRSYPLRRLPVGIDHP